MTDEIKRCPFCGEEIKKEAIKCKHCGKFLNKDEKEVSFTLTQIIKFARIGGMVLACVGILVFVIWVFGFDYAGAMRNRDTFWYGQYLMSGILHALFAILCGIIALILKK